MSTWTTPKQDWQVNDIVTAQDLNTIGTNLAYLKQAKGNAKVTLNTTSTNQTAFVTLSSLSVTTLGGAVLVGFYAPVRHETTSSTAYFDFVVNGTRIGLNGNSGSLSFNVINTYSAATMIQLVTSLGAGTHTIALQWRCDTQWLSLGKGQFWVVEL